MTNPQAMSDDAAVLATVGRFLSRGLESGDPLLVIATEPHRASLLAALGEGGEAARASGALVLVDAAEILDRVTSGDVPEAQRFGEVVGPLLEPAVPEGKRLRVYAELVELLWQRGNVRGALRMEELLNEATTRRRASVMCAYVIDGFYRQGTEGAIVDLRTQPESSPSDPQQAEILRRRELEGALRQALSERGRELASLRAALERESEARKRAEANDAFKENFLGVLGHDLRNPLNTVLTTARLMMMRGELSPQTQPRVDRMVASGMRMQRMISQLLDVTSARNPGGIPIDKLPDQDLTALVSKIVDELRAQGPDRVIEFDALPCLAELDHDRLEQVATTLLNNAFIHGDPKRPMIVRVEADGPLARLSVLSYGTPIEPATLERLFDPLNRAERNKSKSDGLGLGLYIAQQILEAHGGMLVITSTVEDGTRAEATLPRG